MVQTDVYNFSFLKICGILHDFGNFDNQGRLIKEVGRGWMLKGARGDRRRAEHKTKHPLRQEQFHKISEKIFGFEIW